MIAILNILLLSVLDMLLFFVCLWVPMYREHQVKVMPFVEALAACDPCQKFGSERWAKHCCRNALFVQSQFMLGHPWDCCGIRRKKPASDFGGHAISSPKVGPAGLAPACNIACLCCKACCELSQLAGNCELPFTATCPVLLPSPLSGLALFAVLAVTGTDDLSATGMA